MPGAPYTPPHTSQAPRSRYRSDILQAKPKYVRITISHSRSKEQVVQAVDRSFEDLFRGIGALPVRFSCERRSWQGSTLTFELSAAMGVLSTPIKGTIEVTEKDMTIDADLGLFERLIPATKVRESILPRIRGLLN